jgi:HlyD family secretion protein
VAALGNATANADVSKARLEQAEDEYERNKSLFEKNVITEKEYKDSRYGYVQAVSNLKAAQALMKSATVNLSYARITSPIAGTITERAVEEGQTVAASFATPTLFIIAENLSKMQIVADVDEGDIGYIKLGMKVRFSVQTYPERKFYGQVSQVRLQPSHINNVVNYKVIVSVSNEKGLLLPGMTASLDFISASEQNTLLVNNSVFRFRPDAHMFVKVQQKIRDKARFLPDSVRTKFLASLDDEDSFVGGEFRKKLPPSINAVFYQTGDQLDVDFVKLGITTGQESAIDKFLTGTSMRDGARIINGIKTKEK